MEDNFNTINLEYKETKKVSILGRIIAIYLIIVFTVVPIYEFIEQLRPKITACTYGIVGTCGCVIP